MEDLSRRKLITTTSLGLAAAGALAVTHTSQGAPALTADLPRLKALPAPVVAQVEDLASGRVALHIGERTVQVVDHALAQSIARHVA